MPSAASPAAPLLRVHEVTKAFGGLVAVNAVSFDLAEGAIAAIIGPNGAGKTTLFNMVSAVTPPTRGRIEFRGRPLVRPYDRSARATAVLAAAGGAAAALMLPWGEPLFLAATRAPFSWGGGAAAALGVLAAGLPGTALAAAGGAGLGAAAHAGSFALGRWRPDRAASLGINRTFQNIRLFRDMTVLENVLVGRTPHLRAPLSRILAAGRSLRAEERAARGTALEALAFVGLAVAEHRLARHLAYGDQRRLEIARALAARPGLLLLDEPTAGMNPTETEALTALIRAIRDRLGITVLLIEHHMSVVMGISERVLVLDHGEQIADGPPAQVREDPRVIEAYLGTRRERRHA